MSANERIGGIPKEMKELHLRDETEMFEMFIVEQAGGTYIGRQEGLGGEYYVLFNNPSIGSTLALKRSLLSVGNVRAKIDLSTIRFLIAKKGE